MVFVLDKRKRPLMPCSEKRARKLLQKGRAVVHRMHPFTIRLKDRTVEESELQPLRLKLDPGAKVTGVAVLREDRPDEAETVLLAEIRHRTDIKQKLEERRYYRRIRRNRKTRYRKPRFLNRRRPEGWLPPSLRTRVEQTLRAVEKLRKLLPITAISVEHIKFDTQKLQNPEISGIEYQQGTLFGYEVREYLLEKWGRRCAYCGKENVPLEIEHIIPKSRGGTDRVSNLTLACHECNQAKGNKTAAEFGYPHIQEQVKRPLKAVAFMNATRFALYGELKATGLPVEGGSGARTKMNRIALGLSKTHYYDACSVGQSTPGKIRITQEYVQIWSAVGRGTRRMHNPDKYGFPRSYRKAQKRYFGFSTGDLVRANVPKGKYAGVWTGTVTVRASGSFDLKDVAGKRIAQGIHRTTAARRPLPSGMGRSAAFLPSFHKMCYYMNMQRTIRLRLNPTPEQSDTLLETLRQHTTCFNAVAAYGWMHAEKNGVRLHHATYYGLRERFPNLPAQLVIAARVRATEAVKSALVRRKKGKKASCPRGALVPIRYDARTYSIKPQQGTVSLSSIGGRLKVPFAADPHAQSILAQATGFDSADLLYRKGRFWLHVVVTILDVGFQPSGAVVGVDMGLSRPAVCSNNRFFGERRWKEIERRYFRLRRSLQRKGTRSAKRHLRKLAGKVNRFRRDCDHVLSRRIVDSVQPGTVIVVENLVDIRTRTKQRGRESRRRLHSWSFARLRSFLAYKADAKGCKVVGIDPRHTSQMCSRCGHIHRSNRRSQSRFLCRACGFELNADLNAARNIARKYLASGGMSAAGGPPSTGLSCQPAQAG